MLENEVIQGRRIGRLELGEIRGLIEAHPLWSRSRLSVVLAQRWQWYAASGQLKDMAARSLLLKLHERGPFIANNSRFLILPWVRVDHLASHILGQIVRRIAADWQQRYRHPIDVLETFVQQDRFRGSCYQAANWVCVGQTTGRTRQNQRHRDNAVQAPVKDIYLYALRPDGHRQLCR